MYNGRMNALGYSAQFFFTGYAANAVYGIKNKVGIEDVDILYGRIEGLGLSRSGYFAGRMDAGGRKGIQGMEGMVMGISGNCFSRVTLHRRKARLLK